MRTNLPALLYNVTASPSVEATTDFLSSKPELFGKPKNIQWSEEYWLSEPLERHINLDNWGVWINKGLQISYTIVMIL